MSQGPDSVFFDGVTNLPQDGLVAFGVKGLMESNADVKDAVLFHLLSYISDQLLVQKNAVGVLDEFYLFLTTANGLLHKIKVKCNNDYIPEEPIERA